MKPSKICLILPGLDAGGIENYVLRFLQYKKEVSTVTIVSRNKAKGDLFQEYLQTGATLHWQQVSYLNPWKWFLLLRFFRKNSFTVVCDFSENFAGIPMLIATMAGVKKRIAFYRRSSHAFNYSWYRLAYAKMMNLLVYNFATAILSNSRYAFHFFFGEKQQEARFRVIHNGLNASDFAKKGTTEAARKYLGILENVYLIGHCGRYDVAKNHETWFKVAYELTQKYKNIRFLFCGKGTDSPAFLAKLQSHKIDNYCYAIGLSNEVPLVLQSMDLFYFPSVTEGQPNALIEAFMAGVPVLASNIDPIKEAVPVQYHDKLLDPMDVLQAVTAIEQHYNGEAKTSCEDMKAWATKKFDADINFKLFNDELS